MWAERGADQVGHTRHWKQHLRRHRGKGVPGGPGTWEQLPKSGSEGWGREKPEKLLERNGPGHQGQGLLAQETRASLGRPWGAHQFF